MDAFFLRVVRGKIALVSRRPWWLYTFFLWQWPYVFNFI